MLPSLQLLEKVSKEIKNIPNRKKESKRGVHFCLFLLGYKAGLRISEAVNFSLENKTKQGLYRIKKSKGKKERLVYIPKKVIKELRKSNWQPNQTNRWNFYHFLKKIKRELNISESAKLTPHTLRHAFTTYQAESGIPLPILQKLLGHSSIRTTALYWKNIYQEPNDEVGPILVGKKWLERKPPKPITENFPEIPKNSNPIFIEQKPAFSHKKPIQQDNSLSVPKTLKKTLQISINQIPPSPQEKFSLESTNKKNDQLKTTQQLTLIPNQRERTTKKEAILLQKIKQLEEQLKNTATERDNLKIEKERAEQLAQTEKQRADQLEGKLKVIEKFLCQIQKINYYKKLEQEQKAQIEQSLSFKPPNR